MPAILAALGYVFTTAASAAPAISAAGAFVSSVFLQLVIGVATSALSEALENRFKKKTIPPVSREIKSPTSAPGKSFQVMQGRQRITSPQVLWFGDATTRQELAPDTGKKQ